LPPPRAGWKQIEPRVRRRRERGGRLRDLSLLGAADRRERSLWYRQTRRRTRRSAVGSLFIGVVASVLLLGEEWENDSALPVPSWLVLSVTAFFALIACGILLQRFSTHFKDPLLLIARVTGGVSYGVRRLDTLGHEGLGAFAKDWLRWGYFNPIILEVEAAARLHVDGTLGSEPAWRGHHVVGARWRVVRDLIDFEHCAFLCAGDGSAQYRISDLVVGAKLPVARPARTPKERGMRGACPRTRDELSRRDAR
jgi:hypothetical protein